MVENVDGVAAVDPVGYQINGVARGQTGGYAVGGNNLLQFFLGGEDLEASTPDHPGNGGFPESLIEFGENRLRGGGG